MRKALALLTLVLLLPAGLVTAAAAAKTKAPARKSASRKTASKTAKKTTAKKGSTRKRAGKKAPPRAWRTRQTAPTAERYQEIQEALIKKGYLQGARTGTWDAASTDALRRFQQDQKIEPSGKIDSLSLIALGLGPKYDTTAASPPPAPKPAQ